MRNLQRFVIRSRYHTDFGYLTINNLRLLCQVHNYFACNLNPIVRRSLIMNTIIFNKLNKPIIVHTHLQSYNLNETYNLTPRIEFVSHCEEFGELAEELSQV
jgi:hypothetical protein